MHEEVPHGGGGARRPDTIGPYRILDELGEGGMGTVYLAEQLRPVQRRVALKLVKLGMDSKEVLARFAQERQALALMDHDGIAKIFDCGVSERGQPYFAMEYVKGVPLHEYCEKNRVSLDDRLRLLQQVCDAVQHAHQKGVVHRDLKPNNVLVADQQGAPRVKIIDFGLAKAMGRKLVDATLFTEIGRVLGTFEYMAPEQADPDNADIDTRADVYSLGVILYEVLVGSLPFPGHELRRAGALEMVRILREDDPQRPSARLSSQHGSSVAIAGARRTTAAALQKALRGDLDWVVLRALEKDRTRRYQTADALAADLQRFLEHEPLAAGPPSARYRLAKVLRRYRVQALVAAAVLCTAVIGGGIAVHFAVEAAGLADRIAAPAALSKTQRAVRKADTRPPATPKELARFEEWLGVARGILEGKAEFERRAKPILDSAAASVGAQGQRSLAPQDVEQREQQETFADLVSQLAELELRMPDMQRARDWALVVGEATTNHPRAGATWSRVRETLQSADGTVVSAAYRGQSIDLGDEGIVGLVPIGIHPITRLWEFYDLRSAWSGHGSARDIPIPEFEDDRGTIQVRDSTGIVFVLVPGGTFPMGAQSYERSEPDFDPHAERGEEPGDPVRLDAFLLARHELTNGQWQRLMGGPHPSPGAGNRPKNRISWLQAHEGLRRSGMCLPTEAQWEYACRAGTRSPWSTGNDAASLRGRANIDHDEDGSKRLLSVGAFPANDFGLHDMEGNVMEWCRDQFGGYEVAARSGDGLRGEDSSAAPGNRILRGGSFNNSAAVARSAHRKGQYPPSAVDNAIGVRPARTLRP